MSMSDGTGQPRSSLASDLLALLQPLLPSQERPSLCNSVLPTIIQCISSISTALRASHRISEAGSANTFGDEQLNVDVSAERIIRTAIAKCPSVQTASSEEDPVERPVHGDADGSGEESAERYTLAFDPLDGSSIIAPNWTVGTIVGVWDGVTALQPQHSPQDKQIAAVLGVYGPRTIAIVALRIPKVAPAVCFEVVLGSDVSGAGTCEIIRSNVQLLESPFKTRYFAPANLRAAAEHERYMQLIEYYVREKYTLRYSGGLVPDVVHALVKGHGIYISPVTAASKAKLRRLYELAPVALIMECSGGSAIDPVDGRSILERSIEHCDERAGLICGTKEEVVLVKQSFVK